MVYEQHGCVVLPDGDIMLFDNGHYRSKNPAHYRLNRDNYSRGVRYRLDLAARTVQQIWQYGKERGADFFSPYICNVEYYGEGHYMVHSGGVGYFEDCKYGPVERLYRDCRAMWLEEGAPTVQRITISRNTIKHGAHMEYVL